MTNANNLNSGRNSMRDRIYSSYVASRSEPLVGVNLDSLTPRKAYLRRLIRRHFPADRSASILDVGCGHGALIHFARLEGYQNLLGVDVSTEQVAFAAKLGIDGIVKGDLQQILTTMDAESKDLVVAFDVVEHFTREELLSFVDEVKRVLRPGGKWIIHTLNGESPFVSRVRYGDLTHELAFTRSSISQLLFSSGFRAVEVYEDVPSVHGPVSAVRYALWHLFRSFIRFYVAVETGDLGKQAILSQNFLTIATK